MNRYWKTGINYLVRNDGVDYSAQATEITKEEYDAVVTLPAMTADNINHNYFNAAEVALRKEKQRYQNSLFTVQAVTLSAVIPLGTKFVSNIRHLTDANKVLYDNFNEFLKQQSATDLLRAKTFYDAKLAGDTEDEATKKAQAIVIDLSNIKALDGKNEFIAWLNVEHPELTDYINNVASLNYTTFLTEDEAE